MDVEDILEKTKEAIKNNTYDMVPTEKNRNSRRKYGLSMFEIEDFLSNIEKEDLIEGPVRDYDVKDEYVFIFKKEIFSGIVFYVKLKEIKKKEKGKTIKILSCHEDE